MPGVFCGEKKIPNGPLGILSLLEVHRQFGADLASALAVYLLGALAWQVLIEYDNHLTQQFIRREQMTLRPRARYRSPLMRRLDAQSDAAMRMSDPGWMAG